MSCGGSESVNVSTNSPITKTGFLRRYNKGFFSNGWKLNFFKLHADSTLAWYESDASYEAKGCVRLQDTCQFLAVGKVCRQVPKCPDVPPRGQLSHMMAIPLRNSKTTDMTWVIYSDQNELNAWMTEIVKTLPPPPQAQQTQGVAPSAPPGQAPPPGFIPGGGPQYPPGQPGQAPPPYQQRPPQQQAAYPQQQAQYPQQQAQYPQQQAQYPQQQAQYPQQQGQQRGGQAGGNTTVIVQDRGRGGNGGDGLATGMLMGAALGYGMGRPWGFGYGWGGGYGYGGYGGWGGGGGGYHEGDNVSITNNYNVDNSNTENTNVTETNTENNYGGGEADQGGYDQGQYGGGYDQGGNDQGGYDQGGYDQGGYDQGGGYDEGGGYDDDYGGGDYDGGDFGGGDFDGGDFGD